MSKPELYLADASGDVEDVIVELTALFKAITGRSPAPDEIRALLDEASQGINVRPPSTRK